MGHASSLLKETILQESADVHGLGADTPYLQAKSPAASSEAATGNAKQPRALLVHENPFELAGWRQKLDSAGISNTLTGCSAKDVAEAGLAHDLEFIILDLTMEDAAAAALAFIGHLRQRGSRVAVLALVPQDAPLIAQRALRLGADGCILKDEISRELSTALWEMRAGRRYLSHEVASEVAVMRSRQSASPLDQMSARELRTFELLARGKCYEEIADELDVSYRTIAHTSSMLKRKLGARSLAELTRIALDHFPHEGVADTMPPMRRMTARPASAKS